MMVPDVHTSKCEPTCTALRIPSGIEMRYVNKVSQLLLDEQENSRVARVGLAKIDPAVVPQHQEEALVGRLIEAKLLLQALDEFRIEALSAAIFGICRIDSGRSLQLAARAQIAPRRSRDPRGGPGIGAGELGDDPLHRTAR